LPEYAVSARSVVLGIGLENLLSIQSSQRSKLLRIKTRMMRIYFQVSQGLANLLEYLCFLRRIFEIGVLLIRGWREHNFSLHAYSSACLANEPR
jgi:hypothetical protein